jgi:hypothetical protein
MKLDLAEVNHHYITKIVIFSLFLFKGQIRQPNVYKQSVLKFVNKRLQWNIELKIDTGLRLDKDEEREIIIDQIFGDIEDDYLSMVTITYKTPLKTQTMKIDLREEEKYEKFIYS